MDQSAGEREKVPGTEGSSLEVFIRAGENIERLHPTIFGLLLVSLSWLVCRGSSLQLVLLSLIFFTDWLLLALLPLAGRSFGPAKPPTLILAILRMPFALIPMPLWVVAQVSGTVLVIYAFWVEPQMLRLRHQSLTSPYLPAGASLRLVHFGDLHIERITQREQKLLKAIAGCAPDLILFSGDVLNYSNTSDEKAIRHAERFFSQLQAPLSVFAVSGSPPVDQPKTISSIFDAARVRWLQNECVDIAIRGVSFSLVGVSCSHRPWDDAGQLEAALNARPPGRFTILLYHSPDLAPQAAEAGLDLQLSGHTHGGQVCLPLFGAIVTSSLLGKRYEAGRFQVSDMVLYVTRGIGMEGKGAPRARFLCPPEVICWEISGEDTSSPL